MKSTGFIFGVFAGLATAAAYDAGTKAKKTMKNGKRMIKETLDAILD